MACHNKLVHATLGHGQYKGKWRKRTSLVAARRMPGDVVAVARTCRNKIGTQKRGEENRQSALSVGAGAKTSASGEIWVAESATRV